MGNYRKINILAKALDNSRKCHQMFLHLYPHSHMLYGLFSPHIASEQHHSCADPYKVHTEIPENGGGPSYVTSIDISHQSHFALFFVLDARISVRPANAIER